VSGVRSPITMRHHHCMACLLENVAVIPGRGLEDIQEEGHHPEEWVEADPLCHCERCQPLREVATTA
jgi:hypothetical protein